MIVHHIHNILVAFTLLLRFHQRAFLEINTTTNYRQNGTHYIFFSAANYLKTEYCIITINSHTIHASYHFSSFDRRLVQTIPLRRKLDNLVAHLVRTFDLGHVILLRIAARPFAARVTPDFERVQFDVQWMF
jgi:hypothetical protein